MSSPGRVQIVIVGCGCGGPLAAKAPHPVAADARVIARNNYHLFQPLLYQVASAARAPAVVAQPVRHHCAESGQRPARLLGLQLRVFPPCLAAGHPSSARGASAAPQDREP